MAPTDHLNWARARARPGAVSASDTRGRTVQAVLGASPDWLACNISKLGDESKLRVLTFELMPR